MVYRFNEWLIRFEETSAVTVDDWDSIRVRNGNLVRLDSDQFAVLCVGLVDGHVSAAKTALVQIPEIGELGQERSGNILY